MSNNIIRFAKPLINPTLEWEDELRLKLKSDIYEYVDRLSVAQVMGVLYLTLREIEEEQDAG
jgi:hypothetical protein